MKDVAQDLWKKNRKNILWLLEHGTALTGEEVELVEGIEKYHCIIIDLYPLGIVSGGRTR